MSKYLIVLKAPYEFEAEDLAAAGKEADEACKLASFGLDDGGKRQPTTEVDAVYIERVGLRGWRVASRKA
mgnify:CR=1 FL=1